MATYNPTILPDDATEQQVYDAVAAHLLSMGSQSKVVQSDSCKYRGPKGKMCAVGVLIPNEIFDVEMEFMPISRLLIHHRSVLPSFLSRYEPLLSKLQMLHDWNNNWLKNRKGLSASAKEELAQLNPARVAES